MRSRLISLGDNLRGRNLLCEALLVDRLIKISSIPGIDSPTEEVDIEDVGEAMGHLENNPGLLLHLDNPYVYLSCHL